MQFMTLLKCDWTYSYDILIKNDEEQKKLIVHNTTYNMHLQSILHFI